MRIEPYITLCAVLGTVAAAGCTGPGNSNDAGIDSVVVNGIWVDLASVPNVTCSDVQFSFSVRARDLDVLPASAFTYMLALDATRMDAGITETPVSNTCFAATATNEGSTVYSACFSGLRERTQYFVSIGIGFDGGTTAPAFQFATPACATDGGTQ